MKTDETPFYLGSQLLTKKLLCFRLFAGTAILVAFSCGLPAQPSAGGNSSYQTRSEAALNRRQLAGLTQDVAAMRELVDKLQFELQALQRTNQELRQRLSQVQQAQAVPPPQAGLGTAEMEKILSGMRSKFYQDMDKLEKKFFTSLEDMQKQMNRALNDVASAPTNAAPPHLHHHLEIHLLLWIILSSTSTWLSLGIPFMEYTASISNTMYDLKIYLQLMI